MNNCRFEHLAQVACQNICKGVFNVKLDTKCRHENNESKVVPLL